MTDTQQLIDAFNERLCALEVVLMPQRVESDKPQWDNWQVFEFQVRPEWRHLIGEDNRAGDQDGWQNEAALPNFDWEDATDEAIYWDDLVALTRSDEQYAYVCLAVAPDAERMQRIMDHLQKLPAITDEQRAAELKNEESMDRQSDPEPARTD